VDNKGPVGPNYLCYNPPVLKGLKINELMFRFKTKIKDSETSVGYFSKNK